LFRLSPVITGRPLVITGRPLFVLIGIFPVCSRIVLISLFIICSRNVLISLFMVCSGFVHVLFWFCSRFVPGIVSLACSFVSPRPPARILYIYILEEQRKNRPREQTENKPKRTNREQTGNKPRGTNGEQMGNKPRGTKGERGSCKNVTVKRIRHEFY